SIEPPTIADNPALLPISESIQILSQTRTNTEPFANAEITSGSRSKIAFYGAATDPPRVRSCHEDSFSRTLTAIPPQVPRFCVRPFKKQANAVEGDEVESL